MLKIQNSNLEPEGLFEEKQIAHWLQIFFTKSFFAKKK